MKFRISSSLIAAGVLLAPIGCLKGLRKDPSALDKISAPQPALPIKKSGLPESIASTAPDGVQPPKVELKSGAVPAMPGLPGTASQPLPRTLPDSPKSDDVLMASAADEPKRKGILERIKDRLTDRKRTPPELPSATEPKKEAPKKIEPIKDDPKESKGPLPTIPDSPKAIEMPKESVKESKPKPTSTANADHKAVRELVSAAAKKYADVPDYEAKLSKREAVGGKAQPLEEIQYRFRKDPLSVHMRVTGSVGEGREVMYVKGQNDGKMTVVTGKGDNILFGAGKKMTFDPDDPLVTSKSRYKIYEAGLGRPISFLTKYLDEAEAGKRPAESVKSLGKVERKEYSAPMLGAEVVLAPGDEAQLPKGGKRHYFFDADPKSQSFGLPVLIISFDHNDKEVEYYCFTDFKLPAKFTDADFDPAKLGKKK